MKRSSFFIITIGVIFIMQSCSINTKEAINRSFSIDSIDCPDYVKSRFTANRFYWTKVVNETVEINLIADGGNSYCFVNECMKKKHETYYAKFDNAKYYNYFPDYDSSSYDKHVLTSESYNPFSNEAQRLSKKYHYIFELKRTYFEKNLMTLFNDTKSLEEIVNDMKVFNNFKISNQSQLNLLIELYKFSQIVLSEIPTHYPYYEQVEEILSGQYIVQITTSDDLNQFKKSMESAHKDYDKAPKISRIWMQNNIQNMVIFMSDIENSILKDDVTYFYTLPDFKLFKLEVKTKNGRIDLESEYLNPEFKWIDFFYCFYKPYPPKF